MSSKRVYFFIWSISIFLSGCADLIVFDRDNPFDPKSEYFKPAVPCDLHAEVVYYSDDPLKVNDIVRITWNDNSDFEDAYLIERRIGTGDFETLNHIPPASTEYYDTLKVAGIYTYRVTALSDKAEGTPVEYEFHLSPLGPGPEMNFEKFYAATMSVLLNPDEAAVYSIPGYTLSPDYQSEILDLSTLSWRVTEDTPWYGCRFFRLKTGDILCFGFRVGKYSNGAWRLLHESNFENIENAVMISEDEILFRAYRYHPRIDWNDYMIYTISGNSLRKIKNPPVERSLTNAVLLGNGKVLLPDRSVDNSRYNGRALLYDPASDEWSFTSSMQKLSNSIKKVIRLDNGHAMVVYDRYSIYDPILSPEIYDPYSDTWSATALPYQITEYVKKLSTGKVMITVSPDIGKFGYERFATAVFDPESGIWTEPVVAPKEIFFIDSRDLNKGGIFLSNALVLPEDRLLFYSISTKKTLIYRSDGISR